MRAVLATALVSVLSLAAGVASAQPVTTAEDMTAPPAVPPRPRMTLSVGMGASFDSTGFAPERTRAVPAFLATGLIGDGPVGFGMQAFSSQATGRYRLPDAPVDRLGLDAMLVVRPAAHYIDPHPVAYWARVLRALAVELGLGFERDGRGPISGSRFGVHTGAHALLPLSPEAQRTQLGIMLGFRALFGLYVPRLDDTDVGNTAELYGALAVSF